MITFDRLVDASFPLGTRVLVRDNDWGSKLWDGEITGYRQYGSKPTTLPLIKRFTDGKSFVTLGLVVKYSDELHNHLVKLPAKDQWLFLGGSRYWK